MSAAIRELQPSPKSGVEDLWNFVMYTVFPDGKSEVQPCGYYEPGMQADEDDTSPYELKLRPEDSISPVLASLYINKTEENPICLRLRSDGQIHCEIFDLARMESVYDFLNDYTAYDILCSLRSAIKVQA